MKVTGARDRTAVVVATWFGCGFFPVGPGTAGSIAAVVIAIVAGRVHPFAPIWWLVPVIVLFAPSVWAATVTAQIAGKEDPGLVVVDEVLGQWLTLAGAVALNWKSFLIGLLLFRLFDIWKPWPARNFEKLRGGYGIIADDLMAGVYGALVLYVSGCFNFY